MSSQTHGHCPLCGACSTANANMSQHQSRPVSDIPYYQEIISTPSAQKRRRGRPLGSKSVKKSKTSRKS